MAYYDDDSVPPGAAWLSLAVEQEAPLAWRWTITTANGEQVTGICLTRRAAAQACTDIYRQAVRQ